MLRQFSTSDHVYYICTKWFQDGDVHKYFSPYESPFEAYMAFMNALNDIGHRAPKAERAWRLEEGAR